MSILILAGDKTNYYLYKILKENNYQVKLEGFSHLEGKISPKAIKIGGYKTIITPIPYTIDGTTIYSPYSEESIYVDQIPLRADRDSTIIGGPFNMNDRRFYDITRNNFFTDKTVTPSCEEIIKILIDKSDSTISGAKIGLIGKSRISKKLGRLLKLLGAEPLYAEVKNLNSCSSLIITSKKNEISDDDLKDSGVDLIIDITNSAHDREVGKLILKARGLPGKSAPLSVAEYIYETILKEGLLPEK